MKEAMEPYEESSESNSQTRCLSKLKRKIKLSNAQLNECLNDFDTFCTYFQELNNRGISKIIEEQYEEGLIYLSEGERILEYAASCGKSVDRCLIITILHNEACTYQRLYDLPKLSSYLEALIYNLDFLLKKTEATCNIEKAIACPKNQHSQSICDYIKWKKQFATYHLQYCALNSKNYDHQNAIQIASKFLLIMKEVCQLCFNYEKNKCGKRSNNILHQLSFIQLKLEVKNYDKYLRKVRKQLLNYDKMKPKYESVFEDFSIGKIMQIGAVTLEEVRNFNNLQEECNEINKIKKALYIAAGYFSIGTELRLISSKVHTRHESGSSENEFKLSEVYHLYCILITLTYVPCQTLFLNHLITSYNNHYSIELDFKSKKRPISSRQHFSSISENDHQPVQVLPEHSELDMEGQSKWSKSNQKSPNIRDSKSDYDIKVSLRLQERQMPESEEDGYEDKKYKNKMESQGAKGSSLNSNKEKKRMGRNNSKINNQQSKTIKQFLQQKNRKSKSKEKKASNSKTKDYFKLIKQLKVKKQPKKSKEKSSKERKKMSSSDALRSRRSVFIFEKNPQKTIVKPKQKKSQDVKRRLKKTLK